MARARTNRRSVGYGTASAVTVRELVFIRVVVETARYLEMRAIPFGEEKSAQEKVQRGIVRGMSIALTKMYGNGYEPYWTREIKACEGAAAKLAKEWISDGKPGETKPDVDGWWLKRRDRFWRSDVDAGAARA